MRVFDSYEWTDDEAHRIFDEIKQTVNEIWRKAASDARNQPTERVVEIRREAFRAAKPYVDDANALRKIHAQPRS